MNNDLLGEQIARFRKAVGLTQEDLGRAVGVSAQAVSRWECGGAPDVALLPAVADTLGVTVDALFGREGGEKINVEDMVWRWILTVPRNQRVDRLCRLMWTAAGPAMSGKPEEASDIGGYENRCESDDTTTGKPIRWLRRTKIMMEDGSILGVRANDMSFVTIWPEPEAGWEAYLEENSLYRRLFAVLARPHALEVLEYLNSKSPYLRRRYTPGAVARSMGIEKAETEELMEAMAEIHVLGKSEMELEDGVVSGYLPEGNEALVPLLYFARWLTTSGGNYLDAPYRESPVLRGEKWKETEKTEN